MRTPASAGEPIHPILTAVPGGMFVALLLFDFLALQRTDNTLWRAGIWLAMLGLAGALAAVIGPVMGTMTSRDGSKRQAAATTKLVFALLVLATYIGALWVRWPIGSLPTQSVAVALDAGGVGLVLLQGWLPRATEGEPAASPKSG